MEGSPHSADTRARVIAEFAACGRVDLACKRAGVDRSCHYDWLQKHEDYAAAFEAARKPVADMLEDLAVKRAVKCSDDLLKFLLMARNPRVFGRKQEISGPDGKPLLEGLDAVIADYRAKRD